MNQPDQYLPMRDPEAFNSREGVCYCDEQGNEYTYSDFLTICNADEVIAASLFSLVYWASPTLHFFLDEELPIARQTRRNDAATRWLQFKETPSQEQIQALWQSAWLALVVNMLRWLPTFTG